MQSRAEVVPLAQGDAVIFTVHNRPVNGTRGAYLVNLRHGVSRLRSGHRYDWRHFPRRTLRLKAPNDTSQASYSFSSK
jgi:hypothetical protein